jgi:hypothetical protein
MMGLRKCSKNDGDQRVNLVVSRNKVRPPRDKKRYALPELPMVKIISRGTPLNVFWP